MAEQRKSFLLRIDADLYAALSRWAADELRSLNGQIEFLLRRALVGAGRLPTSLSPPPSGVPAPGRLPTSPGRQPEHASGGWDAKED